MDNSRSAQVCRGVVAATPVSWQQHLAPHLEARSPSTSTSTFRPAISRQDKDVISVTPGPLERQSLLVSSAISLNDAPSLHDNVNAT